MGTKVNQINNFHWINKNLKLEKFHWLKTMPHCPPDYCPPDWEERINTFNDGLDNDNVDINVNTNINVDTNINIESRSHFDFMMSPPLYGSSNLGPLNFTSLPDHISSQSNVMFGEHYQGHKMTYDIDYDASPSRKFATFVEMLCGGRFEMMYSARPYHIWPTGGIFDDLLNQYFLKKKHQPRTNWSKEPWHLLSRNSWQLQQLKHLDGKRINHIQITPILLYCRWHFRE